AIHIAPPYSSLTASIRMKSRRRGGMRPAVFLNSTGFSSRHYLMNKSALYAVAAALLFAGANGAVAQRSNEAILGDTVTGAAKGAVIGAIAGDAGAGAAAGAVGGALFGGMQRRTPDTPAGDMVSGAAKGAIVGAIAGDAGAGAAAGAIGGVLFGQMRRSR
ncbi:glycine zipper family protein, partial [Thiococcus pfennigii]|uniref:glycine zipper family protein n=2 Tax=Thiococcus pfennigii TaxID=1057 RepID=UPI0030B8C806